MLNNFELGHIIFSLSNWAVLDGGKMEVSVNKGGINITFSRYAEVYSAFGDDERDPLVAITSILHDITLEKVSIHSSVKGGGEEPMIESFCITLCRPDRPDR